MQTGPTRPHHTYLGGSDIAAVCGFSPYASALDVWAAKMQLTKAIDNDAMHIGRELERPVLERLYSPENGTLYYPGTIHLNDWCAVTPDAYVVQKRRFVECKIVGFNSVKRWGPVEDGADGVPEEVICQLCWQTGVTNKLMQTSFQHGDVFALKGTKRDTYELAFDAELFGILYDTGESFWRNHVLTQKPPTVRSASVETLRAVYPYHRGSDLGRLDAETEALIRQYWELKPVLESLQAESEVLRTRIQLAIGDQAGLTNDTDITVTWKASAGRPAWKQIAEELGVTKEMIAAHTPQYGGRQLRIRIK